VPHVGLFQIFSAKFLSNIIRVGSQLGKLSQKIKRVNFLLRHSVAVTRTYHNPYETSWLECTGKWEWHQSDRRTSTICKLQTSHATDTVELHRTVKAILHR